MEEISSFKNITVSLIKSVKRSKIIVISKEQQEQHVYYAAKLIIHSLISEKFLCPAVQE